MRWAGIMDLWEQEHEAIDRTGGGRLVEVYPAIALRRWQLVVPKDKAVEDYKKQTKAGSLAQSGNLASSSTRPLRPVLMDHGRRREGCRAESRRRLPDDRWRSALTIDDRSLFVVFPERVADESSDGRPVGIITAYYSPRVCPC